MGGYFGADCATAHFEWLGVDGAVVQGISADGKVVVGSVPGVTSDLPARWTEETGYVPLESMNLPVEEGDAFATNADGSVVVGQASLSSGAGAFRWSAVAGLVLLGIETPSRAVGVSSDGKVVTGRMPDPHGSPARHAFRWASTTGTEDLVALGMIDGDVLSASADGAEIVGQYTDASQNGVPFLWTESAGLNQIGEDSGIAEAISLDGSAVVGVATGNAFVYLTHTGQFLNLPLDALTGVGATAFSDASAVSGDGAVIGGTSQGGTWIWDATHGVRLVTDILTALDVDLDGYSGFTVKGISQDGKIFTGACYRRGVFTGYIARL